jgi:hypothetical protein
MPRAILEGQGVVGFDDDERRDPSRFVDGCGADGVGGGVGLDAGLEEVAGLVDGGLQPGDDAGPEVGEIRRNGARPRGD